MFQTKKRIRVSIANHEPSLTQQSDQKQTDIHYIMKKFERTGVLDHNTKHEGTYGDHGSMPDYVAAHQMIADAKTMFETVPATIRAKHDNDPAKFLDWINNEKNREEILESGFTDYHLPDLIIEEPVVPPVEPDSEA